MMKTKDNIKTECRQDVTRFCVNFIAAVFCIISAFASYDAGSRNYCFLSMTLGLGNFLFAVFSAIDFALICWKMRKK